MVYSSECSRYFHCNSLRRQLCRDGNDQCHRGERRQRRSGLRLRECRGGSQLRTASKQRFGICRLAQQPFSASEYSRDRVCDDYQRGLGRRHRLCDCTDHKHSCQLHISSHRPRNQRSHRESERAGQYCSRCGTKLRHRSHTHSADSVDRRAV